jgi:hypothetical protein
MLGVRAESSPTHQLDPGPPTAVISEQWTHWQCCSGENTVAALIDISASRYKYRERVDNLKTCEVCPVDNLYHHRDIKRAANPWSTMKSKLMNWQLKWINAYVTTPNESWFFARFWFDLNKRVCRKHCAHVYKWKTTEKIGKIALYNMSDEDHDSK